MQQIKKVKVVVEVDITRPTPVRKVLDGIHQLQDISYIERYFAGYSKAELIQIICMLYQSIKRDVK